MGELEEKIKKELLKSGFPLQIFCQRCLLQKGWDILESSDYYIGEDGTKKEIDVIGLFMDDSFRETIIHYEVHIECKKNVGNHWVFFKDESLNVFTKWLVDYEITKSVRRQTKKPFTIRISHPIEHLHCNNIPTSSTYTMAFRKNTNQIYEAVSSVLSSYQLRRDFLQRHIKARQSEGIRQNSIGVSFLIILFEGRLFLADVGKDDSVDLVETGNIIYCQKEIKFPRVRAYNINVVTRDYFLNYLDMLNEDRKLISKFYGDIISKGGDYEL